MLAQVLIVTFVLCLGLTALSILVSRQLLSTYASELLRHHFFYLAAFHAFAFYGLWGQVLTRGLLSLLAVDGALIEIVAGLLSVLGVPFLFVSWLMLLAMAFSLFGKTVKTQWLSLHVVALFALLLAAWVAISLLQADPPLPVANLPLIEAATMIGVELLYFAAFFVVAWRLSRGAEGEKRKMLLTFAGLMVAVFAARSLLASLVLIDVRLGAVALLAYFASNVPPLLYLRSNADRLFAPVKAEQATKAGVEHLLDRYGVTRRERQIVEKICLGKTNKQIADELFISVQTVKDHTHRIYGKIGVGSRMQLVQLLNAAK